MSVFQVTGGNPNALFTLKVHRGEGMALLAMNWKQGPPPRDFVGFAIEYREPGNATYFALNNRLAFEGEAQGTKPTLVAPIQKWRWVHFPRNADLQGSFHYRVTPMFQDAAGNLTRGDTQEADIELARDTWAGQLNVTFTRGFVSSQAFVDKYASVGDFETLIPGRDAPKLNFVPTHPKADEALAWMGFEARRELLAVLEAAKADATATVRVIAYDLNQPEVYERLLDLGARLRIVIDDSDEHGEPSSPETVAAGRLAELGAKVRRQHLGNLQHNKTIVVDGATTKRVVCGSTNFSWRGLYVQNNNAIVLEGARAVQAFGDAFERYWAHPTDFPDTPSADWVGLGYPDVDVKVSFSPHNDENALLAGIAADMRTATSSMLYSLAFLHQTGGPVRYAVEALTNDPDVFVYGVSDKPTAVVLQKPDGNLAPVSAQELGANAPEPFRSEPAAAGGTRMHHKFVVIDFDKPSARVYTGSYNMSRPADRSNGENLLLIRDRAVATSYMIEALRIFDHYHFRVAQAEAEKARKVLALRRAPQTAAESPWWAEDYEVPIKIRDRRLFA